MTAALHAHGAGQSRPPNDEAPAGDTAQGFKGKHQNVSLDLQGNRFADQAATAIEGEAYAQAYLQRVHAETAQPGELALILAFLSGEMLRSACRVIEKALGGQRHA